MRAQTGSRALVFFIVVIAALDTLAMGIVTPVLPRLIEKFIGSNADAGIFNGLIIAIWALMQFFASPFLGALSDRFGRRPVLLVSAAGLALHYLIMALAPNLWWLFVARIISGTASASVATVYAYAADVTTPRERAGVFGLIGAGASCGIVAGPLLGGLVGEWSSRAPFWVAGCLSTLAFLYSIFILPESLPLSRRMDFSSRRATPAGALRLLRSHPELTRLAMIGFFFHLACYVISVALALYASYRYQLSVLRVGTLFALVGLLDMVVLGALVAPMTKRLGDRPTMVLGLFMGAVGFACMALAPNAVLFAIAVVPCALRSLALPTMRGLMTQRVSDSEQGQIQGANMGLLSIAGVVAPVFFGMIYSVSASGPSANAAFPGAVFWAASFLMLLSTVGGWLVNRGTQRNSVMPVRAASTKRDASVNES